MRALSERYGLCSWCAALASVVLLSACPGPRNDAPAAVCTKAYEKCQLASGVLGVCDDVDCPAGQAPPCLVCRSQH
jgi:hypothetical protein